MLTAEELGGLADLCTAAGCPALLTLSVTGRSGSRRRIRWTLAWRRRSTPINVARPTGALLGPDAPAGDRAARPARRRGPARPSPWRLGASDAELIAEWFAGWVGAACEQEPALARAGRRLRAPPPGGSLGGQLQVTVDHADLLVHLGDSRCGVTHADGGSSSVCSPRAALVAR